MFQKLSRLLCCPAPNRCNCQDSVKTFLLIGQYTTAGSRPPPSLLEYSKRGTILLHLSKLRNYSWPAGGWRIKQLNACQQAFDLQYTTQLSQGINKLSSVSEEERSGTKLLLRSHIMSALHLIGGMKIMSESRLPHHCQWRCWYHTASGAGGGRLVNGVQSYPIASQWNKTISYGLGVACLTKCLLLLRWLFLPVQVSCGGSENCLMN